MAFDVVSDGYWVICDNGSYDSIYKISLSGSLLVNNTNAIAKTVQAVGVELMSGYLWVLRGTGKIDQVRITDFSVTTSAIVLQFGINYAGITSDGTYLIVGSNDNYTKLYHVDTVNNVAINQITFDNILTITDLAYDGSKYYILNSSNQLQSISGNTVDIDVYRLRNEIQNYKYVNLVDDMGITTRVFASNFSSNRKDGYEHMYDISMTINKIDRG
jgi:WD40 repeat protein